MKYQLEIQNITKSYGDLKANDEISLNIKPASIHALLGENGAGKSTLVKVIYGSLQADSGQMQWCGEGYSPKSPFEARKQGIAMVFQHFSLFDSLTVAENIILGLDDIGLDTDFTEQITKYSKQYGLDINPQQVVGDLSVGARQRVEIIRCLMQNPKLLIMDEPTSVLTPQEVTDLFITLRKLAEDGCAILYISHKLEEVRQICTQATILRGGKLVQNCNPQDHNKQELAEMMIGKKLIQLARSNITTGQDIFSINNLSRKSEDIFGVDLHDISLTIKKGSIVGIAGVAGNGQDELMELLIGEVEAPAESLVFKDKDLAEVVRLMGSRIASWHLTQLDASRAVPLQDLADVVSDYSNSEIKTWPNPLHAYKMAMQLARPGDRVVVFGSFYLVGAILKSVSEDPLQA